MNNQILSTVREMIKQQEARLTTEVAKDLVTHGYVDAESVKLIDRIMYQMQEYRKSTDNQARDLRTRGHEKQQEFYQVYIADTFRDKEEGLCKVLEQYVYKHPLWNAWLEELKGIAYKSLAVVLAEIDIKKSDTVSQLWSYSGYGVIEIWIDSPRKTKHRWFATEEEASEWVDKEVEWVKQHKAKSKFNKAKEYKRFWNKVVWGHDKRHKKIGQCPRKGERLGYNPILKNKMWMMVTSINMHNKEKPLHYRIIFDKAKDYYYNRDNLCVFMRENKEKIKGVHDYKEIQAIKEDKDNKLIGKDETITVTNPDSSKKFAMGHIHKRAMRIAIKEFLKHLWEFWRSEILDPPLPTPDPWAGHDHTLSFPRPTKENGYLAYLLEENNER